MNLRFRSRTEIKIAQGLDRRGVLFIPSSSARLSKLEFGQNRPPWRAVTSPARFANRGGGRWLGHFGGRGARGLCTPSRRKELPQSARTPARFASCRDRPPHASDFVQTRVIKERERINREPDFLACYQGKWGVLEVDGGPFRPPSRTAQDHERDRLFKAHGVRVVEHYDGTPCYEAPDKVVDEFLNILANA